MAEKPVTVLLNGHLWKIFRVSDEVIRKKFNEEQAEKHKIKIGETLLGFTYYQYHEIYINDKQCKSSIHSTVVHELTHALLHEFKLNRDHHTDEDICSMMELLYPHLLDARNQIHSAKMLQY